MSNRISFYTLGCRLNQSETAVIQNSFEASGYSVVDFDQPADIVVVNTCTVTENGDADTRRLVNKINRINPQARIALIGCQAQTQKGKLAELTNVRWIVGNARKFELVDILKEFNNKTSPQVIAPIIPRGSFTIPVAGVDRQHTRANLKIQDGCDFFCSFCEIPYARGRARSREFSDILKEAVILAQAGHKELVVTGINVGTYCNNGKTFLDVIDALTEIKNIARIRISSIEPTTIPIELIERMGKNPKLCRYLHIPLQSGSNPVLKSMKRKYTTEEFCDFIHTAHNKIPELCIGTDVIVGFPGETDNLFSETEELLRCLPFSYFHVFSYSERTMAKSRHLAEKVPLKAIQERSQILRDLSNRKRRLFHQSLLGTTQTVLCEQKKNEHWHGWTDHYVRVKIKSNNELENSLVRVTLKSIADNTVVGKLS